MKRLERALAQIRPSVRAQRPYLVGAVGGDITVKLNQNESPFDLPKKLKEQILDAWQATPFNRYPKEQPNQLCQAIGGYLDWDPEGIIAGNGSNELM